LPQRLRLLQQALRPALGVRGAEAVSRHRHRHLHHIGQMDE